MNPRILPLPARPYVYRMLSRSMEPLVWTVWTGPGGRAACNCLGGRGWRRACYHMKEVLTLETALALRPEDEQELAPIPVQRPRSLLPMPVELKAMVMIAKNVPAAAGHAVPRNLSAGQAFAVMLAGWEFGVGPMTALRHVTVINGRTEPDAQLMMGICRALEPSLRFRWLEVSSTRAELELVRHGEVAIRTEYTSEDAAAAGQGARPVKAIWHDGQRVGEEEYDGPWQTHPHLMLAYNAAKIACKLGAPDLINRVQGAAGFALESVAEAMEGEEDYEDSVIGTMDNPDFEREAPRGRRAPTPTPTPRGGGSAPPSGRRSKTAAEWKAEIDEALIAYEVTPAALAALVGGDRISHMLSYMERERLDLPALMRRAKADPETGEIPPEPDTIDGESREVGDGELPTP